MRNLLIVAVIAGLSVLTRAIAADNPNFEYEFALSFERSVIDNVGLGDDPTLDDPDEDPVGDRLIEEDYEFEFDLRYRVDDNLYLFFAASLIDETETLEFNNFIGTRDASAEVSGLERKEMGLGIYFGEEIESELKIGRMEFVSASESWLWWDEELDAISLESSYDNFEVLLGIAEEQGRETTDADFIDPEIDGIRRIIASLSWEFAPDQSLNLYYLDQQDNSSGFYDGLGSFDDCEGGPPPPGCELEDFDRIDEEDADLTWTGVSYLGEFENDVVGELEVELHYTRVSGDEVVYEFDELDPPDRDLVQVTGRQENRVSGSAQSFLLGWTPATLDDWSFIVGRARGSGDARPDDKRNESFRQTGLQGDAEVFGELYQPEMSNIVVQTLGVEWEINDTIEVALLSYDYKQDEKADEMRDVNIEADLSGLNRDLGSEIDLVVTIEAYAGLELILIASEFEAGKAYGSNEGDSSSYFSVELNYEF